jgi:hypothetical protein
MPGRRRLRGRRGAAGRGAAGRGTGAREPGSQGSAGVRGGRAAAVVGGGRRRAARSAWRAGRWPAPAGGAPAGGARRDWLRWIQGRHAAGPAGGSGALRAWAGPGWGRSPRPGPALSTGDAARGVPMHCPIAAAPPCLLTQRADGEHGEMERPHCSKGACRAGQGSGIGVHSCIRTLPGQEAPALRMRFVGRGRRGLRPRAGGARGRAPRRLAPSIRARKWFYFHTAGPTPIPRRAATSGAAPRRRPRTARALGCAPPGCRGHSPPVGRMPGTNQRQEGQSGRVRPSASGGGPRCCRACTPLRGRQGGAGQSGKPAAPAAPPRTPVRNGRARGGHRGTARGAGAPRGGAAGAPRAARAEPARRGRAAAAAIRIAPHRGPTYRVRPVKRPFPPTPRRP